MFVIDNWCLDNDICEFFVLMLLLVDGFMSGVKYLSIFEVLVTVCLLPVTATGAVKFWC